MNADHDTRPTKARRLMETRTGRRDTQTSERPPNLQSKSGKMRNQGPDGGIKVASVPHSIGTIAPTPSSEPLLTSWLRKDETRNTISLDRTLTS